LGLPQPQPPEWVWPPELGEGDDPWTDVPKAENFFSSFSDSQLGQAMAVESPITSFSKSLPQSLHTYSNIGIFFTP